MKQETTVENVQKRRKTRVFSAKEKVQAVMSLWSGRRSASELMRQLEVPWGILRHWEQRALSGMLTALDPTWKQVKEQPSLPQRVERLIEQAIHPAAAATPAATN